MINVWDMFYVSHISFRNNERLSQCKKCRTAFEANFGTTNVDL